MLNKSGKKQQGLAFNNQKARSFGQDLQTKLKYLISLSHRLSQKKNTFSLAIKELAHLILIGHTLLGYLLSVDYFQSNETVFSSMAQSQVILRLFEGFSAVSNLALITTLCLVNPKFETKVWFTILQSTVSNFQTLAAINLAFSSFLVYSNFNQAYLIFAFSAAIYLFSNVVFGNLSARNIESYQTSHSSALIFKFGLIVHLLTNGLTVNFGKISSFLYFSIFMGLLCLFWYLNGGYNLYIHRIPRNMQILYSSMFLSINAEFIIVLIRPQRLFSFIQWSIGFALIGFYLIVYDSTKRLQINSAKYYLGEKNLKTFELNAFMMLQESDGKAENIALLTGVIFDHYENSRFLSFKDARVLYEGHSVRERHESRPRSKMLTTIFENTTKSQDLTNIKEKDEILKLFIKNLYERALIQEKAPQTILDYCQFMVTHFQDFSAYCIYLEQVISSKKLDLLQKIRAAKLKLIMHQQSVKFNKLIFGGKLERLTEVILAQNKFQFLTESIKLYSYRLIKMWEQIKEATENELNLSEVKQQMLQNFKMLPQINQGWREISTFFSTQKEWKLAYLNYCFYLKNQKIKAKPSEVLEKQSQNQHESFTNFSLLTEQNMHKINNSLFFDENSAIIVATIYKQQLVFKKVSKNFSFLTQYHQQQIVSHPVTMIMLEQQREIHDQRLFRWMQKGKSGDQSCYRFLSTSFETKSKREVPCFVFFKIYIDLQSEQATVKYACLLRSYEKKQPLQDNMSNSDQYPINKRNLSRRNFSIKINLKMKANLETAKDKENIFIKEDQLKPVKVHRHIKKAKTLLSYFVVTMFAAILTFLFYFEGKVTEISKSLSIQSLISNIESTPLSLATTFMDICLFGANSSQIERRISEKETVLRSVITKPMTIKIIADSSLNLPANYFPYYSNKENRGLSFNQIDLYYQIYSSLFSAVKHWDEGLGTSQFMEFDSYLHPSYTYATNSSKIQLHRKMEDLNEKIQFQNQIFIGLLFSSFVAVFSFACILFCVYMKQMDNVLEIIVNFDSYYASKIISHWNVVLKRVFDYRNEKRRKSEKTVCNLLVSPMRKEMGVKTKKVSNLSKKTKKIIYDSDEQTQKRNFYISFFSLMLLLGSSFIISPLLNIFQTQALDNFQRQGFPLLEFAPNIPILNYALIFAFQTQHKPTQNLYDGSRFQNIISNIHTMSFYEYTPQISTNLSPFHRKTKQYLFENPCPSNPLLLSKHNLTLNQCLKVANGTFSLGMSTYLRNYEQTFADITGGHSNYTRNQVINLSKDLKIFGVFYNDLLQSWKAQLQEMVGQLLSLNRTIIIVSCFIACFSYILLKSLVIAQLQKHFEFMKFIYDTMTPQSVLVSQKLTKNAFQQTKIIQK